MTEGAATVLDWIRKNKLRDTSCYELMHLFSSDTASAAEVHRRTISACAELVDRGLLIARLARKWDRPISARYFVHIAVHQ